MSLTHFPMSNKDPRTVGTVYNRVGQFVSEWDSSGPENVTDLKVFWRADHVENIGNMVSSPELIQGFGTNHTMGIPFR